MKIKKLAYLGITAAVIFTISCGGRGRVGGEIEGQSYVTEGWVDDNTFRVSAIGTWPQRVANKNFVVKRNLACEAALVMAQKAVVEKLIGATLKGTSGVVDGEAAGLAIKKEFAGAIRGGSIIKKTYDQNNNCEIIYEIRARNLKQRVQEIVERYLKKVENQ